MECIIRDNAQCIDNNALHILLHLLEYFTLFIFENTMCYTTIKESDKLVIFVKQNLTDIESINELTNTVNKIITEGENKIIIDLEDVHFINAFGISKILSIYKELKRREGELYLANLTNRIKELFNILMLDKVFKVWNYDKKQNLEPSR